MWYFNNGVNSIPCIYNGSFKEVRETLRIKTRRDVCTGDGRQGFVIHYMKDGNISTKMNGL